MNSEETETVLDEKSTKGNNIPIGASKEHRVCRYCSDCGSLCGKSKCEKFADSYLWKQLSIKPDIEYPKICSCCFINMRYFHL